MTQRRIAIIDGGEEAADEAAAAAAAASGNPTHPLFPQLEHKGSLLVNPAYLSFNRIKPVEDSTGQVPADEIEDQATMYRLFGPGTYDVMAFSDQHRFLTRRKIVIGGTGPQKPMLAVARQEEQTRAPVAAAPMAPPRDSGNEVLQLMTFFLDRDAKAQERREQERREDQERREQRERDHELRLQQMQIERDRVQAQTFTLLVDVVKSQQAAPLATAPATQQVDAFREGMKTMHELAAEMASSIGERENQQPIDVPGTIKSLAQIADAVKPFFGRSGSGGAGTAITRHPFPFPSSMPEGSGGSGS